MGVRGQITFPALGVRIVATDADDNLIRRAAEARYCASGLKDLPVMWRDAAFEQRTGLFCLKSHYKSHVELSCSDLRTIRNSRLQSIHLTPADHLRKPGAISPQDGEQRLAECCDLSAEIRQGRSDRDSSPCPTQPRSHAQTPLSSRHMHRLPRWLGAGSSNRR